MTLNGLLFPGAGGQWHVQRRGHHEAVDAPPAPIFDVVMYPDTVVLLQDLEDGHLRQHCVW